MGTAMKPSAVSRVVCPHKEPLGRALRHLAYALLGAVVYPIVFRSSSAKACISMGYPHPWFYYPGYSSHHGGWYQASRQISSQKDKSYRPHVFQRTFVRGFSASVCFSASWGYTFSSSTIIYRAVCASSMPYERRIGCVCSRRRQCELGLWAGLT